ncbi:MULTISPECIES: hypothetical protein [Halobacteriovorax]|uniref:STAS domain-containing protein n=1 Tax=Halobacteriovorax vibrionivorans TaxID=2152716 RepID=A0ABY0IKN4_9BACT|nr:MULTISPECIES: hypothetical protein [Halobacteriovorax]AYF43570.1 hypothetical protein BALOs_0558 [Halobacteriovorax sp. BALOs_7]RZF21862.1 hypothetical protein DAY19_09235 [Halobacteriovorax vibrionivorans]TGD48304.1 hypothetical protein EP118_04060 [Halobacteriovorax sp. Y22]
MSNLSVEVKTENDTTIVNLTGRIDEDADLKPILDLKDKKLHINFNNVEMINSCGIREWINMLGELSGKITYSHCPQSVIEQINMVHGFIKPGIDVESFYAPYYEESTDEVKMILINTSDVVDNKAPVMKNDAGEELEFDAIEAQYFQFIKQMS